MATSRPDGLPLHGDAFDYALCDMPTFTGDMGRRTCGLGCVQSLGSGLCVWPRFLRTGVYSQHWGQWMVAGPTREYIQVLVPDCHFPPVGNDVQIDLRHVVELRMGPAFRHESRATPTGPHPLLVSECRWSRPWVSNVAHTGRKSTQLLTKWCSVNNDKCPECNQIIKINMSLSPATDRHYTCVLLEVSSPGLPPLVYVWTEREGSYRAYPSVPGGAWALVLRVPQGVWVGVVREPGFLCGEEGDRTIPVDGPGSGKTLWPGVEKYLHHHRKPGLRSQLRRFFKAAVDQLQLLYDEMPLPNFSVTAGPYAISDRIHAGMRSTKVPCRQKILWLGSHRSRSWLSRSSRLTSHSALSTDNVPCSSFADVTPLQFSHTCDTGAYRFLETGAPGSPLTHILLSRAAVPGMCIASTDLLSYIDPLPMDRLALHDARAVHNWPA